MSIISFPQQKSSGNRSYPNWLAELDMYNNGVDGAFNPSSNTELVSGIHRFSSFNIPSGVTVTPKDNYLIILVDGPAVINGLLSASGKGGGGGRRNAILSEYGNPGQAGAGAGAGGGGGGTSSYYDPNYSNNYSRTGGGGGGAGGAGTSGPNGVLGGPPGAGAAGGYHYNGQIGHGGNTNITLIHRLGISYLKDYKGGGGGGASGMSSGESGGAGAGALLVVAKNITGYGGIVANGIDGANGVNGTSIITVGGGGGGGGGLILTVSDELPMLTMSASGGKGGIGTKDNWVHYGGNGGNGLVLNVKR